LRRVAATRRVQSPSGPDLQIGSCRSVVAAADGSAPRVSGPCAGADAAATTPEQEAVLAGGKVATIKGELVEASCYLELGKRGEAHRRCGADCIKHGQPAGILDDAGKLTLLFVEQHDPRRYGEIDVRDQLASLVARRASATGMLTTTKDGQSALYVQGSDISAAETPPH
jgi:hypothetical protein